jgi:predicted NUDIX family NTP pyrophosphohydrolase
MRISSGTLLYRLGAGGYSVLLVHPSGSYNRGKPWSIPKGLPNAGETLEETARRETWEETGVQAGPLADLGFTDYRKSKKRIHCFAGPAPECEPACRSWEVDQAQYVPLGEARRLLHPDQQVFLDRLLEHLQQNAS